MERLQLAKKSIVYILFTVILHALFQMTITGYLCINILYDLVNVLFFFFLTTFFFFCLGNSKRAILMMLMVSLPIALLEVTVMNFRGVPITFSDIGSVKTALSVAKNFDYLHSVRFLIVLLAYAALIVFLLVFYREEGRIELLAHPLRIEDIIRGKGRHIKRTLCALSMAAGAFSYVFLFAYGTPSFFRDFSYAKAQEIAYNGVLPSFFVSIGKAHLYAPSGYDASECEQILKSAPDNTVAALKTPHIIAIMCEAFSDPTVLGDAGLSKDFMPVIRSLCESGKNTISGNLNVSVFGGNTASTEFEFLTGNSMKNLPFGSIAYQSFIKNESYYPYALPNDLKAYGYKSKAFHPFHAGGYNRKNVYEVFGFDETAFQEAYENADTVRDFVSDAFFLQNIIENYERQKSEGPLFYFGVTMQNHAFYSKAEVEEFNDGVVFKSNGEYDLKGYELIQVESDENTDALETYLTLESLTDKAMRDFVHFFDREEEPVIILFFGDHQPSQSVTKPMAGKDLNTWEYFRVPFFLHANFDMEEVYGLEISPNFLSLLLYEAAELPLNAYQVYLKGLYEEYSVVSDISVVERNGERHDDFEETFVSGDLLEYERLQYYTMFDLLPEDKAENGATLRAGK